MLTVLRTVTLESRSSLGQTGTDRRHVVSLAWKEHPSEALIQEQVIERTQAMRRSGFEASAVFALEEIDDRLGTDGDHVTLVRATGLSALVGAIGRLMLNLPEARDQRPILICRGALVATAAITARAVTKADWVIVHDVRGWYAREGIEKGDRLVRRRLKRSVESLAFRQSDCSVVVSQALVGIALAFGADPRSIHVIPPYTRVRRSTTARPHHSADVIYVGNSRYAHQPQDLIRPLLISLAKNMPATTFGWLDSSAPSSPEALAPNLWRRRVSADEVDGYLNHAGVGLVIREASSTNAAAFPTKAVQYLTAGCAIVTTPYPPAIGEICRMIDSGRLVGSLDPEDWGRSITELLDRQARHPLEFHPSVIESWARLLRQI